jgi:hypothetical protein
VAAPPAGSAPIVTVIHIGTYQWDAGSYAQFAVETGTACTGSVVGDYDEFYNAASVTSADLDLSPGLAVPAGDSLCGHSYLSGASVSVSGYTVPSSAVPAEQVRAGAVLTPQS